MNDWLKRYEETYGDRIRKNRPSVDRIMAMTKLPQAHARALQIYCHGSKTPHDFLIEEAEPVEPTVKKAPKAAPAPKESSVEGMLLEEDYTYNANTHTYLTFLPGLTKPLMTSEETHKNLLRAYSNHSGSPSSINEIARTFGWPREWVVKYLKVHEMTHDREPFSKEEILSRPDEDLMQDAFQQRRNVLHKKLEKDKWAGVQRDALKWNHFEETVLKVLDTALTNASFDLRVPTVSTRSTPKPFALVVTPADLHYGKIGVNGTYDRKIAKDLMFQTTQDLLAWVTLYGTPEEIIMSGLGDWFHVDNDDNETTKGTKQDVDIPFPQLLREGCELMASYIQILKQIAPVRVITIPGNHDSTAATTLNLFISAFYKDDPKVTVTTEANPRQYAVYGQTLLGFAHGQHEKPNALGQLMANENSKAWGTTQNRIWFIGHTHHEVVNDMLGVQIISIPSLTGTDRWHHQMGYVGSRKALAGFILDREKGLVNSISVPVKN